jgi:hypothetical protein
MYTCYLVLAGYPTLGVTSHVQQVHRDRQEIWLGNLLESSPWYIEKDNMGVDKNKC